MDIVAILLFWLFALWGFISKRPVLIYVFFASMSFGSFAVLPPPLTGGLTFTPTPIVAVLIIARYFLARGGVADFVVSALSPRRLLWLFLFWLVAALTTLFMPRLLAGAIQIIPMRGTGGGGWEWLQPTTQNISQLVYLTISVALVFAWSRWARSDDIRRHTLIALCVGGMFVLFTGVLDYASQYAPISPVLEPFRTATYALLTDVEVFDSKRVVGLMPEASSYGSLCITFLTAIYFFRRALPLGFLRRWIVPAELVLLLLFVWLSTSSAAYVGLVVFFGVAVGEWLWRAFTTERGTLLRRGLTLEFSLALTVLAAIVLTILVEPRILNPIVNMFNEAVLQKSRSASYEERSMWTAVSWQAALDSWGLGVGMGATRASNSAVALVSNIGFLGALLYFGFVFQSMTRRTPPNDDAATTLMNAVRWSWLPGFIVGLLAGTSADFGLFFAWLYGMSLAIATSTLPRPRHRARLSQGPRSGAPPLHPRPAP